MRINILFSVLLYFIALLLITNVRAEESPLPIQLITTIYQAPTPMVAMNKNYLVYEIYLTNYMKSPATLTSFSVMANSKRFTFDPSEIKKIILTRNTQEKNPLIFQPGESKLAYMWLSFNKPSDLPHQLIHQFTLNGSIKDKKYVFNMQTQPLIIDLSAPVIISAPLRGKNWLSGNAPSNTSDHRTTGLILKGQPYYAQRYAIDFVQIGSNNMTFSGDMHKNSNYYCYNQDVLAVTDGTVVALQDGVPENIPNSGKLAILMNEKNLPGNYLILKMNNGKYAGYAHLIPGSLKVKMGDSVTRGQVIGKLGNSGNSSEPHLHFQVVDRDSFLASNGIPYAFDHFTFRPIKIVSTKEEPFKIEFLSDKEEPFTNQLVLENALISF